MAIRGGARCGICTQVEKLCVYCVVGAECAVCAHGTVLAWGRKSYFGTLYKDSLIVQTRKHGHPFVTLKPDYAPEAAAAFLQLFCISAGLCIGGMSEVSEWWNPGVLLVFLGQ